MRRFRRFLIPRILLGIVISLIAALFLFELTPIKKAQSQSADTERVGAPHLGNLNFPFMAAQSFLVPACSLYERPHGKNAKQTLYLRVCSGIWGNGENTRDDMRNIEEYNFDSYMRLIGFHRRLIESSFRPMRNSDTSWPPEPWSTPPYCRINLEFLPGEKVRPVTQVVCTRGQKNFVQGIPNAGAPGAYFESVMKTLNEFLWQL